MSASDAKFIIEGKEYLFPTLEGSEGEKAIDTRKLRAETGYITYDEGYGNTGSCSSDISFIDGEQGILRHRGYSIEDLAEKSNYIEVAHLLIYGELPTKDQLQQFAERILLGALLPERMRHLFDGFPAASHPMALLSALINSLGCYYPHLSSNNRDEELENFDEAAALLISKVRTIAAMIYRMKHRLPMIYPRRDMGYIQNFLHMLFSEPYYEHFAHDDVCKALNLMLLLHADHEQNCSTSTVRMVASGGANLFASISAGISALWGPLHGGANMAVIDMLKTIHASGDDGSKFVEDAKSGKAKLMGFGHRVYKNYDPRAKIIKEASNKMLDSLGIQDDPLLDIARHLEEQALNDDYFVERKLYPNVDFYSGIILQALNIPTDMFTVMFAMGRISGWIANWKEVAEKEKGRIYRPRQVYTGPQLREFVAIDKR
tara:strand:+ start:73126 stop:74421 length:1296 start_codon:yes stop_codon:yes gene_type:complete